MEDLTGQKLTYIEYMRELLSFYSSPDVSELSFPDLLLKEGEIQSKWDGIYIPFEGAELLTVDKLATEIERRDNEVLCKNVANKPVLQEGVATIKPQVILAAEKPGNEGLYNSGETTMPQVNLAAEKQGNEVLHKSVITFPPQGTLTAEQHDVGPLEPHYNRSNRGVGLDGETLGERMEFESIIGSKEKMELGNMVKITTMNDIYSLEKVSESVFLVKLLNCEALIATLFLSLIFDTVYQFTVYTGGGFSLYYLKSRI